MKFKSFFVALIAATIETALGKKCDPQTVAFSPQASKESSLIELVARWAPLVDTLLALVTATDDTKDFGGKLSDDQYIPALAKQMNAMLHAMGGAEKHKSFSEMVVGS